MANINEGERRRAFVWADRAPQAAPDFLFQFEGSVSLLHPVSAAGHQWIVDNIPEDAQFLGDAPAIEHRYVGDILFGIHNAGLVVQR